MALARKNGLVAAALASTVARGACARQIDPNVHEGYSIGETLPTYRATVQAVRFVEVQESDYIEDNRTGQLIGGVVGGAVGSRAGPGVGKALAIAGGAIIGSFLGAFVERDLKRQPAIEYVVLTDQGEYLTVVQGPQPVLQPGQPVFVQESRYGRSRIIPAA